MRSTIHAVDPVIGAARGAMLWLVLTPAIAVAFEPVLLDESHFGFVGEIEGEVFSASFEHFSVRPLLDGRRQPLAFLVEVDLASVDSGNAERDGEMRGPDGFDVARWPVATFVSDRIEPVDGGLVLHGSLTLKGVPRVLHIPVRWHADVDKAWLDGTVDIDRRWFSVGPGDDTSIAADVRVSFALSWSLP